MNATTLEKLKAMKLLGMRRTFKIDIKAGSSDHYIPDKMIAHLA